MGGTGKGVDNGNKHVALVRTRPLAPEIKGSELCRAHAALDMRLKKGTLLELDAPSLRRSHAILLNTAPKLATILGGRGMCACARQRYPERSFGMGPKSDAPDGRSPTNLAPHDLFLVQGIRGGPACPGASWPILQHCAIHPCNQKMMHTVPP